MIMDKLIKMVSYKPIKVTINASGLIKVIMVIIKSYHELPDFVIGNCDLVFTSRFWSSLYYFLKIKKHFSTNFHLEIQSQTEKQNSTIKV